MMPTHSSASRSPTAPILDALGLPGFSYADLYRPDRLAALTASFEQALLAADPELAQSYTTYRSDQGASLTAVAKSELLVALAPHLGAFVARLFEVETERDRQMNATRALMTTVFAFRSNVVMKCEARFKQVRTEEWSRESIDAAWAAIVAELAPAGLDLETGMATVGAQLAERVAYDNSVRAGKMDADPVQDRRLGELLSHLEPAAASQSLLAAALQEETPEARAAALLDIAQRWCYLRLTDPSLHREVADWVSFKQPKKTDFNDLVPCEHVTRDGYVVHQAAHHHRRRRDGFALTDTRATQRQALYEVDHCIYCHDRDTDSCSKGMRNKKDATYKVNPLGVNITGCPLEEKISEMHLVKRQGDNIGALALIMIDNPMCPGTGHRICNDCMKGCIYQKTEPVNIPQIETNVLTDVLFMPWGFEIYGLLTRWNPLNVKRPHALPYNGKNVLVVGLGPAGYTLAHYLLNEGFGVTGIDGLKIEPLPRALVGSREQPPEPVRDFNDIYEALDKRIMLGFGGVAEYGITVRWDKNFLKVIYLTLARRQSFRCFGGVRFGGTLSIDEAWALGFHHIAIASGAGKPTIINLKNNLTRGIRKASDFLMGLQLTGAAKQSSLANLQVRLPAGVIGGGLTGIDTATELLAYYPVQVEKILHRYETLSGRYGEERVIASYDPEERAILTEFLAHGRAIRAERARARAAGEQPDFLPLLEGWGGVTLFYRKGMKDAPAYRQNHEEIEKAFEEGIAFAEGMDPKEALDDESGHLRAVRFDRLSLQDGRWSSTGNMVEVPLRSLFVAAGTAPNTIYQSEHPDTFVMDGTFYQRYEPEGAGANVQLHATHDQPWPKIAKPAPLTSYVNDGRYISFYGDNHPVYAGNVVKAMASAKDGYPYVVNLFQDQLSRLDPRQQSQRDAALNHFQDRLQASISASVVAVNRLTPTIIEVIVKAPMQAKNFCPGQFYRVQNLEATARVVENTVLAAEGLALTGAWVDKAEGLISLIALEMGSSSRLCAYWQPGDEVVVMGVTGAPTEIPASETVMLAGGGLGNAVLFSIGKALRAAGNRVIYFAGYKYPTDVFRVEEIEAASDVIVWSVDKGPGVQPIAVTRPQDRTFVGNILEAMIAYAQGQLGEVSIPLSDVEHMIVIGSDRMMAAVKAARHAVLKPYLKDGHVAIGSINSPMQCMMKGVCAQCLCKHIDPVSGRESFVYSCYNQDQDLDRVDFPNLNARLRQNSVQEKLSALWLDYLLEKDGVA